MDTHEQKFNGPLPFHLHPIGLLVLLHSLLSHCPAPIRFHFNTNPRVLQQMKK